MMPSFANIILSLILISLSLSANAQIDSLPIFPFELTEKDIHKNASDFNTQKVMSGSRTLQDVDDLPLTIYVITKEEIQMYGFITLVDVLKHLPGIRVSQPGSALDGETFLMRGLRGNSYSKILINNVPIKPTIASSMPLGAQLPIQQAERIEVIYGPAAAVYGVDASAGVINIIIEKTDRPTFAQAKLNAGSINGYTDLNLLFGGKLGKNKKIVNFSVYGSTTILDDQPIIYDIANNYTPTDYIRQTNFNFIDTSYVSLRNYTSNSASQANFSTIPHLSRMFGLDVYYRNWRMSFQGMYRRDHSAIGMNPLAISYDNPLTYFGESIISTNLGYSKNKKKSSFELNFSGTVYDVDNRSSSQFVRNSLNEAMNLVARSQVFENSATGQFDFAQYDSLKTAINDRYFSGNRYSFAESTEFNIEQVYTNRINPSFHLSFGLNANIGLGTPLTTLGTRPLTVADTIASPGLPLPPLDYFGGGISGFLQTYIQRPKWNMTLGLQFFAYGYALSGLSIPAQSGTNPRLAFLYKLSPKLSIRSFYGTAFRVPSPYYFANSYFIEFDRNRPLTIAGATLSSELTTTGELGIRWNPQSKIKIDMVGFYNFTNNIISNNFNFNLQNLENTDAVIGYFNNSNDALSFTGVQATIDYKDIISSIGLDARLNMQYARSFRLRNRNIIPLFEVPIWSASAIISFQVSKKLSFSFLNNFQGRAVKGVGRVGNFNLDSVLRYDLSDRFQFLFKANNTLNAVNEGLVATNSPDDLFYNPQRLRNIQIGLSYRTN